MVIRPLLAACAVVAMTIIAAIVVLLVFNFVFLGIVSTMDRVLSIDDNKEGYEFHLWNPLVESRVGIPL
jgi:hypothetical protein